MGGAVRRRRAGTRMSEPGNDTIIDTDRPCPIVAASAARTTSNSPSNSPFDAALRGGPHCVLELRGGEQIVMPVARWRAEPDAADELLLARCLGPTLDIGCGPGRLTAALTSRGVPALGLGVSA